MGGERGGKNKEWNYVIATSADEWFHELLDLM